MFYQVKVKYNTVAESGKEVQVSEEYLVDKCILHGEAESVMLNHGLEYSMQNMDVVGVKRSKIVEFINDAECDEIYISTIVDKFCDENGKVKETKYDVGVYAESVEDATNKTNEYMKQGMNDLSLVGVKKTNIVEVLSL